MGLGRTEQNYGKKNECVFNTGSTISCVTGGNTHWNTQYVQLISLDIYFMFHVTLSNSLNSITDQRGPNQNQKHTGSAIQLLYIYDSTAKMNGKKFIIYFLQKLIFD